MPFLHTSYDIVIVKKIGLINTHGPQKIISPSPPNFCGGRMEMNSTPQSTEFYLSERK